LDATDRVRRTHLLQHRAIQVLTRDKQFAAALAVLGTLPDRQPKLEALCFAGPR